MFSTPHVGVRIASITHRSMEQDEAEVPLTEMTCELSPFTPSLAGDLHDFVKRTLYTAAGVEVNSLLKGAIFDIAIRPQQIEVRMTPDQDEDSFTILEAKIGSIKAKRSKKSTAWVLEFTITCSPATEHQLAQIVECYLKTRYLSFQNAESCLFDTEVDETPQLKRKRGGGSAEATAH